QDDASFCRRQARLGRVSAESLMPLLHEKWKTPRSAAALAAVLFASGLSHGATVALPSTDFFEMTRVPMTTPHQVNGGARIPGVFVGRTPRSRLGGARNEFRIFGSAREAAEFSSRGYVENGDASHPSPCTFTTDSDSLLGEPWSPLATTTINDPGGN